VAPDPWPGIPDSLPTAVCFIDGYIADEPGGEPYDRAIVAVVNGKGYLIGTGYRSRLPVRAP
jgi:hypothetical protein